MLRPSTWLPLGILALLVGLTAWLHQLVQPAPARSDGKSRHDPDLIVERFLARKYGEDGRVLYTLAANRMVHYPDDNSAHLEKIDFTAYEPRQPRVTVAADRGRLLGGGDEAWFEGNVVLVRDADAKVEKSRMTTDRIQVLPDEGIARTREPVVVENASGRVDAAGLELNNRTRVLKLDRVRATYKPPR